MMRFLNFRNDPAFQELAQKYSGSAPVIGCVGTVFGIFTAFQKLESESSVNLVAPGILEALFWTAVGITILIVVIFPHYWWIKRR
jgi:biopolymer transport protein ExbB/TolQ